jgi:hypothetical protein
VNKGEQESVLCQIPAGTMAFSGLESRVSTEQESSLLQRGVTPHGGESFGMMGGNKPACPTPTYPQNNFLWQ